MSTTGRSDGSTPAASDIASRLRAAEFVRLVADATGDAVAATGLLATALEGDTIAHQCSVVPVPASAQRETDADLTVGVGRHATDADITIGTAGPPASSTALAVAEAFETIDYELALAGITAAGAVPTSDTLAAAEARGIERRPGVAVPTANLEDGLAHATLVYAPFSGDTDATAATLTALDSAETDEETQRRVASMVAFEVCSDDGNAPQAAEAVERFLRPLATVGGRFETVEGFGDVLDATARERPGLAVPLVLGAVEPEQALDVWRTHGQRAHEAVSSASTGRYDGLYVVRCDGDQPVGTLARLVAAYRSPEPLVVAVDDSEAAAVAVEERDADLGSRVETAARRVDGRGGGTATVGRAQFSGDPTAFVAAFREVQ
jgi:hypothetical protein